MGDERDQQPGGHDDFGHLRVSDAERQQVVDRLSRACGDGMLTLDEFTEHAGAAYASVTRSDLDAVVRNLHLPVVAPLPMPPSVLPDRAVEPAGGGDIVAGGDVPVVPKRRWVVAIMGGEDRRGKWRMSRRTGALALMGGVDLDLRDAILEGEEIEITAWAVMGGVTVIVPEGIPVECSGFMLMGGRTNRIKDVPPLPGAPIIRVKGYGMWGGIDVRSKPPRKPGEDDSVSQIVGRAVGRALESAERAQERAERHIERHTSRHGGHWQPPSPPPLPPMPPIPGGRRARSSDGSEAPPAPAAPAAATPPAPVAGVVTVVCTDIVGSTRYADTLGDQRWRSVLQLHNELVRAELDEHGGTEVKTRGDGFLVTFPSARRAVQFAVAVQERLADYRADDPETPLEVRIGVHAGEVERDGLDVVGRNVSLACRLCDAAAPGEVLASSIVVDLADSASDLGFGPPREHRLAGIERPVFAHPATRR